MTLSTLFLIAEMILSKWVMWAYCHRTAFIVCRPFINFDTFNISYSADFNPNLARRFLGWSFL